MMSCSGGWRVCMRQQLVVAMLAPDIKQSNVEIKDRRSTILRKELLAAPFARPAHRAREVSRRFDGKDQQG